MITPAQRRAARTFLNWSQPKLVAASGVSIGTIASFEKGVRTPNPANLAALQHVLEGGRVEFATKGGVNPRPAVD